ncbi:MAG: JAB domain-containing protein [Christensenellales bacterium]|jgi:DNA repair protein RadC
MHAGHRSRHRTRYRKNGLDGFSDHEILELLLYYAIPRVDTNPIAHRLMQRFGSLAGVFSAHIDDLKKVEGVGENAAILLSLIRPSMQRSQAISQEKRQKLTNIDMAGAYCCSLLAGMRRETLFVVCLDIHYRVICAELVQQGSIDELPVYPRHIVEIALRHDASSIILTHNHPGGRLAASKSDIETTFKVLEALESLGISLLDHIITHEYNYFSFMKHGDLSGCLDKDNRFLAAEDEAPD